MSTLRAAERLAAEGKVEDALDAAVAAGNASPVAALEAGRFLLDHGEPARALPLLERAVREVPRNAAYPVFLALAHIDLEETEKAREALRQALKMEKENRVARGLLAVLALREGNVELGLRILDKAGIEASTRLIGRLLVEVERQIRRLEGPLPTALPAAVAAAPVPPQSAIAAASPADPGTTPQPPPPAEPDRSTLMRIGDALVDPLIAQWLIGRAERALHRGDAAQALHYALRAVARHAEVPRGQYLLGVALLQEKEHETALKVLERAEEVDGSTPDVLYARGCCLHEMGRLDEARTALEKMLAAFAKDAAASYTLGQIELQEGHPVAARRWLERAANLDFLIVRERIDKLRKLQEGAGEACPKGEEAPPYACPGTDDEA